MNSPEPSHPSLLGAHRGEASVRIGSPRSGFEQGTHRVELSIEHEPLWFESPDVPLRNSVEAFGSALLFPAAASGKRLVFETQPDAVWLDNAAGALKVASNWWGYLRLNPTGRSQRPSALTHARPKTTLCFSGGVDSFYSLLRGTHRVDQIVFVHGYDIALDDRGRAAAAEISLRRVAAELGIAPILVRTNLRRHPVARGANWEHTHGGALAAVGHLLTDHADRLLISSSYPRVFDRPWGSHWALDPLWSSAQLNVVHVGAEKWRAEKLVALLSEPMVRQHLRVCWENRSPTGNCGRCEKCLRTMLVLDGHGCLSAFPVFPSSATLAENLDRLDPLRPDFVTIYTSFLEMDLSMTVRSAVQALLRRSHPSQPPRVRRPWWRMARA